VHRRCRVFCSVAMAQRGALIPRIYIIGPAQRMGLGRLLLYAAIEQAATERLSHLWLDVMESATAARLAYAKWGFRAGHSHRVWSFPHPDETMLLVASIALAPISPPRGRDTE